MSKTTFVEMRANVPIASDSVPHNSDGFFRSFVYFLSVLFAIVGLLIGFVKHNSLQEDKRKCMAAINNYNKVILEKEKELNRSVMDLEKAISDVPHRLKVENSPLRRVKADQVRTPLYYSLNINEKDHNNIISRYP